jgi:aspartate kinase
MIVLKFGGSSVKDAEMFKKAASIVLERIGKKPVVVLSAVKGITDLLIKSLDESLDGKFDSLAKISAKHKEIIANLHLNENLVEDELAELRNALETNSRIKEKNPRILDYISFFGERMSVKIMADYLTKTGTFAQAFVSGDIGLLTDSNFGDATILPDSFKKLNSFISKLNTLPVITGFGGKDKSGEYTTFQRGGSDYVASLIGAAVNAKEIQIWTDVDGIMSADPRIVEKARTVPLLSFDEASELAYFGAKVLHPKTILPAIERNIPVLVLNTFNPTHPGSKIVKTAGKTGVLLKAISFKKKITIIEAKSTRMLDAHGFLSRIFSIFEKYRKPVDMISTSEVNVSMTVDSSENIQEIAKELSEIATVGLHSGRAIIYVVGEGMKASIGTAARIFEIVGKNKINLEMISQCFDEYSIGFVVKEEDVETAVKVLHKELINY